VARPAVAAQPKVAFVLAGIGGFVDAVGFLTLFGLFTAHLSGNTARLGVELGRGEIATALTYVVPVVVFFAAVALGAAWTESCQTTGRRALGPLLITEALLVTLFLTLGTVLRDAGALTPRSAAYYGLAVTAVSAMGLQTASLRHAAGVMVNTTFITGMTVSLAEEVVASARGRDPEAPRRARVHAVLLGAYVVGAVLGSALDTAWGLWALVAPILTLVALRVAVGDEPAG
jgi:uncharacterized membrane protein YoaK (UPF0700 family)